MNIAMVGDFTPYGPITGGTGAHMITLSKELIKRGNEVFLITFPMKHNIEEYEDVHIIKCKGFNIRLIRELCLLINGKKKLEKLVKKENIDIIHGHGLYTPGAVATEIGNKYNIPTYVTSHGPDMNVLYKNPFLKKQINKVLYNADKVLAVSKHLMDKINNTSVKNIQEKTSLHFNAVDISKFKEKPKKPNKKPTVIFVGNLVKRKNVNTLLDAKKQSKTNYKLLIVGDGPEKDNLKNKVKNENIQDVTFTGVKRNVENILPEADLFILPSFVEGLSVALIEALACGLPVIGSNIGGMNEAITPDVGLLIDPYDPTSISNAIDQILSDEKLYCKFKSNARKKAMQFSQMKIPYQELKK